MKSFKFLIAILFIQCTLIYSDEYSERRKTLISNIVDADLLVIFADYNGHLNKNFYYLTGITEKEAVLVLNKKEKSETLYLPEPEENKKRWEDEGLNMENVKFRNISIKIIKTKKEFYNYIKQLPKNLKVRYSGSRNFFDDLENGDSKSPEKKNFKAGIPFISQMRLIKSETEINKLRKAVEITKDGIIEAIKSCEVGMNELDLQAILEYVFKRKGARRTGFNSIIGSGPNSCVLHYTKNSRNIESGDLIVIDVGAEFDFYTADITRTIPAIGKFTEEQKKIYTLVLKAQEEAISIIKPGLRLSDVEKKVSEILQAGLIELGFLKKDSKTDELRKYVWHNATHWIGLDVHDVGDWSAEFKAGMILSVEPGLYFPEKSLGVRIEDNVLVTETGFETLSKDIPKKIEEIENLMTKEGIGNIKIPNEK